MWLIWVWILIYTVKFQSTHPRRVWLCWLSEAPSCVRFNPHTHAGCDGLIVIVDSIKEVSIHTPTQGVTKAQFRMTVPLRFQSTHPRRVWPYCRDMIKHKKLFQSTHPRRVWPYLGLDSVLDDKFQSTHPRRVWPYLGKSSAGSEGFNPHTHAGCDFGSMRYDSDSLVSIHTPTQGVTKFSST